MPSQRNDQLRVSVSVKADNVLCEFWPHLKTMRTEDGLHYLYLEDRAQALLPMIAAFHSAGSGELRVETDTEIFHASSVHMLSEEIEAIDAQTVTARVTLTTDRSGQWRTKNLRERTADLRRNNGI